MIEYGIVKFSFMPFIAYLFFKGLYVEYCKFPKHINVRQKKIVKDVIYRDNNNSFAIHYLNWCEVEYSSVSIMFKLYKKCYFSKGLTTIVYSFDEFEYYIISLKE